MLVMRRVEGESMLPTYRADDVVVALRMPLKVGQVVIAKQNNREVLKRIVKIESEKYYLQGDNMKKSTDSRTLGPVSSDSVLGRVITRFPGAVAPVRSRRSEAAYIGYGLAGIMTVLALIHLFRIDTLVQIMDSVYFGGLGWAAFLTALLVSVEVFALPYLMKMRLSPLGHVVSGIFAVLAPLHWLLVGIWGLGQDFSTGQLGEFVSLPSSWWLIVLNLFWLAASYGLLWLRNFERQAQLLRK